MTANRIRMSFEFPDLKALIERERMNIQMVAAATLQTQRAQIFDAEGAYNGRSRWSPLQFRTGMILSRSGGRGLRGSIAPRNNGKVPARGASTILEIDELSVTVGTSLIYAEIHDQGGKITAKPGKYLKIPIPKGAWANDNAAAVQKQFAQKQLVSLSQKMRASKTSKQSDKYLDKIIKIKEQIKRRTVAAYIFRKSVNIPKRTFTDWTGEDEQEMTQTLINFCESLITKSAGGTE
jgi:phage gpG-like protein